MKRIGDRNFLFGWQTIRAATQPNPEAVTWRVGAVHWSRHRYSHAAPDHALTVEVHRLDCKEGKDAWSIMVVVEHWWDERHKPLRNHLWASHVSGSREGAVKWIECRAAALERDRRTVSAGMPGDHVSYG
jgi:hypothetical protein